MKKSTIRTEKRPKKFRLLRAYSILSYEHPPFSQVFFLRLLFSAAFTGAKKLQLMGADTGAGLAAGVFQQGRGKLNRLQIQNPCTGGADEMGVRRGVAIIALQTGYSAQGTNGSVCFEHGQIAVYSAQTQIRNLGF